MAAISAIWTHLVIFALGIAAVARLAGVALGSLVGTEGSFASRLAAKLATSDDQRLAFDVARAFLPNLALRSKFITAYDNEGTVVVTRFDDVKDVLRRDQDFEVVYGPRMMKITAGQNFFLGMQDTPDYTRDVSNMRLAVRREDLPGIVQPFAAERAAAMVKAAAGRIDVPQDLTLRVPAQLLGSYFGTPGSSERDMIAWTTIMFWYLFIDLAADSGLDARALEAAAQCPRLSRRHNPGTARRIRPTRTTC